MSCNILTNNKLFLFIHNHFNIICSRFCVLQQNSKFKHYLKQYYRHFLIAFLFYLGAIIYGILILQWEAFGTLSSLSFKNLGNSQFTVIRQIYLPMMWPQTDHIFLMLFGSQLIILMHFTLSKSIDIQYLFFLKGSKSSNYKIYLNGKSIKFFKILFFILKFYCYRN